MLVREEAPRFAVHGTAGSYVKYGTDPQENALRYENATPDDGVWIVEDERQWGVLHNDSGRCRYPTVPGNYMRFYDNVYRLSLIHIFHSLFNEDGKEWPRKWI